MFLHKKAQSTAEYAIVFALVVAVVAGVLQAALKGGIRHKNQQALNYLIAADDTSKTLGNAAESDKHLFNEEYRSTSISESTEESAMQKGGLEQKKQRQTSQTSTYGVELLNATQ